ncbi:MAG TPA: hypothetical protein VFH95_11200 [Candidatus Kapabacteria bacterium]|nr:hypothetical protein [Candidatus Kapabacteria bacterium]
MKETLLHQFSCHCFVERIDRREIRSTKQSVAFRQEIASSRSAPFGRRTLFAMTT